ncbi:MAG: hypothetical protein IPJ20_11735 [Flammeovirgaceae bacterium]|nr:hypothetical protein [Flammeovirgaceae bacterium]
MKARLKFFGLLGLFWVCFFTVGRILFFIYLYPQTVQLSWREILLPLFLGLRMDAAMAGYWLLIPGLLFIISAFLSNQIIYRLQGFFTTLLLLASSLLIIADIELYKHWGFRINTTPLMYMEPEAVNSVNPIVLVILLLIFSLLMLLSLYVYWKKLAPSLLTLPALPKKWAPAWLIITGLLIIPIRSSFSVAPLNTGVVYFHKTKAFPNHAGINPVWNFLKAYSVMVKTDIHRLSISPIN